jgi:hypothetical protein
MDGHPTSFYAKLTPRHEHKRSSAVPEGKGYYLVIQNKEVSRKNDLEVLKVEGWNQYDWLLHGFSTRDGGVSQVYGGSTLNLGWTKEDDPASVAENRRRFLAAVCGQHPGSLLVGAKQIHSNIIRAVKKEDGALEGRVQTIEGKAVLEGDGLITDLPGILLAVGTADCVPILVADVAKRVVGAFHAGWRGTVSRIVGRGVAKMQEEYGSRAPDLVAAIGPSIGPCCYTVGEGVWSEFGTQFDYARELFTGSNDMGQIRLNLWEANRHQLLDAGLAEVSIVTLGECAACTRSPGGAPRYFSHRAERGNAGRMLNVIGVTF